MRIIIILMFVAVSVFAAPRTPNVVKPDKTIDNVELQLLLQNWYMEFQPINHLIFDSVPRKADMQNGQIVFFTTATTNAEMFILLNGTTYSITINKK